MSEVPEPFRTAAIVEEIFKRESIQQIRILNHDTGEEYSAVEIWPSEGVLTLSLENK